MSVLNQMLRDLESRGVNAAPMPTPAMALPTSMVRSAGGRARGSTVRKILWFGTAMVVTATVSLWAVLEHRVSEARRAPQPLGLQQFGNAISMLHDAEMTPAAAVAPAPATAAADTANATAPVAANNSAAAPATTLASISPPSASTGSDATKAASDTTTNAGLANGKSANRSARGTVSTATSSPASKSAAISETLPSKRRAADALATRAAKARPRADVKAAPVVADTQASSAPIVRASETEIAHAGDLIARGRNSEAQVVLERVLAASPQQVAARQALAALHAESGRRDHALAILLDGAAIDAPHFAGPAAQLQFESGDSRGALKTLARIPLAQRSSQHDALAGGIALSTGMFADAIASYERAVSTPNAPAIWWLGLGLSYEAAGQRSDAHETFARLANATALPNDLRAFVSDKVAALAAPAARDDRAHSEIAAGLPTR